MNLLQIIASASKCGTVAAMTTVCVPATGHVAAKQAGVTPNLGFVMPAQSMWRTRVLRGQAGNRLTWTNRYPVKGALLT